MFHVDSSIIFLSTYFLSTVLVSAIQILDFSIFVLFQGFLIGAISYSRIVCVFIYNEFSWFNCILFSLAWT